MYARRKQPSFPNRAHQRGVVLLIALIFLVLLTLLAIGASSGSLLQQRMVSATRSAQLASLGADTAVRGAEWHLWSVASLVGGHVICMNGSLSADDACVKYDPGSSLYASDGAVTRFRTGDNAWLADIGQKTYKGSDESGFTGFTDDMKTANVAQDPQYIIEDLGLVRPPGAGSQHEAGATGPMNAGGSNQISLHIYRITARATGGTQNTVRVVQSTFDSQAGN